VSQEIQTSHTELACASVSPNKLWIALSHWLVLLTGICICQEKLAFCELKSKGLACQGTIVECLKLPA
jgi:hypothetical protein